MRHASGKLFLLVVLAVHCFVGRADRQLFAASQGPSAPGPGRRRGQTVPIPNRFLEKCVRHAGCKLFLLVSYVAGEGGASDARPKRDKTTANKPGGTRNCWHIGSRSMLLGDIAF